MSAQAQDLSKHSLLTKVYVCNLPLIPVVARQLEMDTLRPVQSYYRRDRNSIKVKQVSRNAVMDQI